MGRKATLHEIIKGFWLAGNLNSPQCRMLKAESKVVATALTILSVRNKETKEVQSTAFSFMGLSKKL